MASNITLQHKAPIATTSLRALVKSTKKAVTSPFEWLRQYYSSILGSEVTMRQTLRYLHCMPRWHSSWQHSSRTSRCSYMWLSLYGSLRRLL